MPDRSGNVKPKLSELRKLESSDRMTLMDDEFRTPGQFIKALLERKGWDQRVLAAVFGVEEAAVSKLISGKRTVDAETAIVLSEVFGVEAERFLQLQKDYELAKARIETLPDPGRATRAQLFGQLPIAEMITRGWLKAESVRNVPQVESELAKFFGVDSVSNIEILPHAAKKTDTATPVTPSQLAWIHRVKQIASEMVVPRFSRARTIAALETLQNLLMSAEEARKVPRILAECGIRFVIVESLKGAKIDGVCIWLNPDAPVIGMSLRYDRIDNFWFVLRHEIEHVLRGHGKDALILDAEIVEINQSADDSGISESEAVANAAAADFCVPSKYMEQFITRKAPVVSKRDMLGFAKTIRVHPGIVAGQLQRKLGRYNLFHDYLTKVRSIVAPSAAIDGWGDIFPVSV